VASTEGGRVDIFHILIPGEQVSAEIELTYPRAYDTLGSKDVTLSAKVRTTLEAGDIKGFSFQLSDDTTGRPLYEMYHVPTSVTYDSTSAENVFTAEWRLESELTAEELYYWRSRIEFADSSGQWSSWRVFYTAGIPHRFALGQNYPNPFNPTTVISYSTDKDGRVLVEVFNLLGQRVAVLIDEELPAGEYEVTWNGRDQHGRQAATGVYFYRLTAGGKTQTRKMVLLR
jgi:hypothetical protein